jgi:hypothetical protein
LEHFAFSKPSELLQMSCIHNFVAAIGLWLSPAQATTRSRCPLDILAMNISTSASVEIAHHLVRFPKGLNLGRILGVCVPAVPARETEISHILCAQTCTNVGSDLVLHVRIPSKHCKGFVLRRIYTRSGELVATEAAQRTKSARPIVSL